MNKKQLMSKIATTLNQSKADAERTFDSILNLILDCLKIEDNYAHFTLKDCLYIHKMLKPKKTILTNLHHDLDYNFLIRKLPKNIIPAYDGLKIKL